MAYKELVPHFHLTLCDHVQNTVHLLKRGYLEPRGHFKSTILSKCYPLWRLCGGGSRILEQILSLETEELLAFYQAYPERDPRNLRIMIIGESDTVAQKNLKDPKWHLQNNDLFKWLFPEIIPTNTNETKWTDDEILLPRTKSFDESTITCDGVGAKRTGFHWDLIVYDDPIGEKASKSEAVMNEAISWFQYAPGMLNDQATSEEVYIGTRWKHGAKDLPGWIMREMPVGTTDSGRPKGFTWVMRSVYNDDGTIGFPERFTDLRYYHIEQDEKGARVWIVPDDGSPRVRLKNLVRESFYDPSSGGQSAESENAQIVAGSDHLKRIFILDAWSKNCSMGDAVENWHQLNDRFMPYPNRYEAVGPHKEVGDIVKKRAAWPECLMCKWQGKKEGVKHRRLNPDPVTPPGGKGGMSKDDRIRDFLQMTVEEHRLYLRRDKKGFLDLIAQIVSFPHFDLKDLVDVCAYIAHYIRYPQSPEENEAEVVAAKQAREDRHSRISTQYEYGGYI
jgi:hypothetical protein